MKKKGIFKVLYLVLAIFWGWGFHGYLGRAAGVENDGLSFGWWSGQIWLSVLVWVVLMFYWLSRELSWGVGLMLTGGGINLMDRWQMGLVRDYWSLGWSGIYNNIADYLIGIGLFVFILELWKRK